VPILQEYRPAAVWLFAVESREIYSRAIPALNNECRAWFVRVFVQIESVKGAREVAGDGTDVIVGQGTDAGSHQFAHGAGLMAVLPEVVDVLNAEFKESEIIVVAAGGIVDGRAIAAARSFGMIDHAPVHSCFRTRY
jgi:nitronate monooxygenase